MSEIKTNKISPRKGTTQTIGDSGDTVSIACGATLTNAGTISTGGITGGTINNTTGTISGLAGVIEWDTTAKTTAFTAEANRGYFVNTTSGAITVTFPVSPTAGDVIGIKDYALTSDTNAITIDGNGNNINGSSNNYLINTEGASGQFIYVDATRGWVLTDASKASDIAEKPIFTIATGGTITCCGDYKIHTFTGPGTFTVCQVGNGPTIPTGGPNTVSYLAIAGGGSGGIGGNTITGGGGGAGGFREGRDITPSYTASPLVAPAGLTITATAFPITVGAGGAAIGPGQTTGNDGSNSIFSTITSAGGGGGGGNTCVANAGGSGGGGEESDGTGGAGNTPPVSPPQGNPGGAGSEAGNTSGGGGGSGAAGNPNGTGGNGVATSITGSSVTRAGGGGANGQSGGSGGGGLSATSPSFPTPAPVNGAAGTTNSGSGGGAAPNPGVAGAGGSGIVIIRYKYQ